jgi:hypothetical protein
LEVALEPLITPAAVAPAPIEEASDPQEEEEPSTPPVESTAAIGGVPMVQSSSGSFHFMQESELEAAQTPFEDGAEWVERSDAADHQVEQQNDVPPPLDLEETKLVNGDIEGSLPEVITNISFSSFIPSFNHNFCPLAASPDWCNRLGS